MSAQSQPATGLATWKIDPAHSEVGFSVRHMMISNVRGRFSDVSGTVQFDPADPTSGSVEASMSVASIDTRAEGRDNHLRSADFFDVEHYPTISFKSKRIERGRGDNYRIVGDLSLRDTTREIVLDAEFNGTHPDNYGNVRAGFSASTSFNRFDFGLNWNAAIETGGVVVGDTVKVTLEIEAVRQQ
ncbi:MAG TPA: YceI family protein [Thermomicrobiaceae bacterium]|nr:YceI family protein [Thermomicrobiaceae bacterium]